LVKGAGKVILGKGMRLLLILLDVTFIFYTVVHMILRLSPIDQPAYWISGLVEVGLALLVYRYWMRSRESKGFKADKIKALIVAALAIVLPYGIDFSDIEFLRPAVSTDFFFYCSALSLLIYSSFRRSKTTNNNSPMKSRP
jgi:hypothetical protein